MLEIRNGGIYISKDYFNVYQTPLRKTTEYELEIYAPCDSFLMYNGMKYPHTEDAAFLIPPDSERFSIGPFSCAFLHFVTDEPDLIALLARIPPYIPIAAGSDFRTRCLEIAACDKNKEEGRLWQASLLISLLLSVNKEAAKSDALPRTEMKHTQSLLRAKNYMDENFAEKITLEKLSQIAFLSKNFFRTMFVKQFGISPTDYLCKVRVSRAIEQFRAEDTPLSEIALSCGFGSQAYMNAVVKKQTGKTPLAFRRGKD